MERHHLVSCGDHAALWDWNLTANRIHYSPRWLSIVGCDEHEVATTPEVWFGRVHPDDIAHVRREIQEHLEGDVSEFEIPHRLLHQDGTYRWTICHGVVERNESGQAVRVTGCHSDVTADKVTDAATGLPNRLLFIDHLARAIERTQRNPSHHFAVLLVDLDRAGRQGDHGVPPAGDPLLTAAARRLETCLRAGVGTGEIRPAHLVARLRGDEFAVLLEGLAEIGDAKMIGDRILTELLQLFSLSGGDVYLSASIGIAVSATGYARAEDAIRDADIALYRAKLLGRARCEVFDTAVLRSARDAVQLENDLREALARREFLLHFQPVVSLASGRIAGFEALVRWQHPARGLVSPGEFIPVAEKTGLIVQLGRWIAREACLQLKAWQDTLPGTEDVWVSVNLSAPQFADPGLVDEISGALQESGLPARCLVVELTEGVAMKSPAAAKGVLMRLRVMGVRIALDDFGTGQSSLAYLHQFPADLLKLDRSFVDDMETRAELRDIIGAVAALARQLGMQVIAEGVEGQGQLDLARSLGCEYVQGFYYSKPVDRERAASLLQSGFPRGSQQPPLAVTGRQVPQDDGRPARGAGHRTARIRRPAYVAAAALVTLMLAGVVGRLSFGTRPPAAPAPRPPAARPAAAPAAAGPATGLPGGTAASSAENTAPAGTAAGSSARPASPASQTAPPVSLAVPPANANSMAARTTSAPRARTAYTFPVLQKRTFKDRPGQLIVSRDGLAFVPDKPEDRVKEGFSLSHSQFMYRLLGDELTVRFGTREYRFKAAGKDDKDGGRSLLHEVSRRIEELRPAKPAK